MIDNVHTLHRNILNLKSHTQSTNNEPEETPWKPWRAGNDKKCWRLQCIAHRWEWLHTALAALAVSTQKGHNPFDIYDFESFELWIYLDTRKLPKIAGLAGQTCNKSCKSSMVWVYYWAEPDYILYTSSIAKLLCTVLLPILSQGAAAKPSSWPKKIDSALHKRPVTWEEVAISVS